MKEFSPAKTYYLLFTSLLILSGFGLIILLASTSYIASVSYGDQYYFIKRQTVFVILGIFLLIIFSQIPYMFWRKLAWPFFGISIFLLLLVFIPGIGRKAGGAYRWINIAGFSVQPSDLARFALLLILSRMYSHGDTTSNAKNFTALIFIAIPAYLIKSEPDLGTAMHTIFFAGVFLFSAGFPVYILATLPIAGVPLMLFNMSAFQWNRIMAFLNPYKYRFKSAFQLIASYKSFLFGGLWGQGLGEGLRRHNLQARHTDFILAVAAEDIGIIGIGLILFLYAFISITALLRLVKIEEPFGRLLGTGIILLFITQAIMNIAVVMGLLPTTGINLPLISYGGTSVFSYLAMFGILLNILKENDT